MHRAAFTADLHRDEAVLRFPYDDRLRRLLRVIPGRRWDPPARAWCVPLGEEQALALRALFASLPEPPEVSAELARAMERRARRRGAGASRCTIELVRPGEDWWLGFALDGDAGAVAALLAHPEAVRYPEVGRGAVPIDDASRRLVADLGHGGEDTAVAVVLSPAARRALHPEVARAASAVPASASASEPDGLPHGDAVTLRRDRTGSLWIVIEPPFARAARVAAGAAGLDARHAGAGRLALAAERHDAGAVSVVLAQLEGARLEPRVEQWLAHALAWSGTVDVVSGAGGEAEVVLLGERDLLPDELKAVCGPAPGGACGPLTPAVAALLGDLDAWYTAAARRCVDAVLAGRPAPAAVLERSRVHSEPAFVLAPGHDPAAARAFEGLEGVRAALGGRGRDEHMRLASVPADPAWVPDLDALLAQADVWVPDDALALLQEIREEHAHAAGVVALSQAGEGSLRVPGLGGELKPFQRAGVAYALERRRAFLADEQGLGKTIEALATLEADGAYPAVVLCPASLKLNWRRELERWLPHRTARVLSGVRPGAAGQASQRADVTVVNYDIAAARAQELISLEPRALILDESHYCKNGSARRTRAALSIADAVPADGLILALTGTPVTNHPTEFVAQLRILGRLAEFGTGARFAERFRGADGNRRLHWHLRARCFVRRRKEAVLPQLPRKTRAVIPLELANEAEYRLAERDVVAWLRAQPLDLRELDAKVAAALRAERLVRLNALKLLAARGKLGGALAWIHDFCSSGERLVVFARHREIQRAVRERFPSALSILGEDGHAARDRALAAFQGPDEPGNQLLVCSLEVAGHGLTLTRASNVVFLELDWTPAKLDQAEDRCHRIGQQDAVNAYYLLAADTIDETIARLLERKRSVIGAVTDGVPEDGGGVVEELVRELRGEPYRHLRAVA